MPQMSEIEQLARIIDPTQQGWAWKYPECGNCPQDKRCSMECPAVCPASPARLASPECISRLAVWAFKQGHMTRDQYAEAMHLLCSGASVEYGSERAFEYIYAAATAPQKEKG